MLSSIHGHSVVVFVVFWVVLVIIAIIVFVFLTASIGSRGPIFFVKSSYHEWKEETSQKSESFDHEHGSRGPSFVFVVDCLLVVGQGLIFFTLQIQERNRKDRNKRRQNTHIKNKEIDKQNKKNRNYKPWSFSN